MRKLSILLFSLVVIFSLVLAACGRGGPEETTPAVIDTPVATELPDTGVTGTETAEVPTTVAPAATEPEAPTLAATETTGVLITETPSVEETVLPGPGVATTPGAGGALPPLGFADPSRLTTLMTFEVRNATGDTLATVDNMVIDLGNSSILHVILASGGFLGIGESLIPVPWNAMQVNPACVTAAMGSGTGTTGDTGTTTGGAAVTGTPGAGATTGGTGAEVGADACYFLLNVDDETLRNAPNIELDNLPDVNTPGWDTEFNTYWSTAVGAGGTTGGTAAGTATPGTGGTAAGTATPTTGGTGGTGAQTGSRLILADDLLGMPVVAGTGSTGGTGGTAAGTSTPGTGGTAGQTGTVAEGETLGAVTDAVVDLQTGNIRYLLVTIDAAATNMAGALIPVPVGAFQAGSDTEAPMLMLNVDSSVLSGAPRFEEGTFPNATMQGWDTELNTYWETQGFTTTTSP